VVATYSLVQSCGALTIVPTSGDGAYATWFSRFFNSLADSRQDDCTHFGVLQAPSTKTPPGPALIEQFSQDLDRLLTGWGRSPDVVVLNWHLRLSSHPNGWTGKGSSPNMMEALRAVCQRHRKQLKITYTIHETGGIVPEKYLHGADLLIALNPVQLDQVTAWARQMKAARALSQVPGMLTSSAASIVHKVRGYLDAEATPEQLKLANMLLFERLRGRASAAPAHQPGAPPQENRPRGAVIFGMIRNAHGLTEQNLRNFCDQLDAQKLAPDFKLIIAGVPYDKKLVDGLVALSQGDLRHRLVIIPGVADDLRELDRVKFAVSFDAIGFRTNASSMINMITNGLVLFPHPHDAGGGVRPEQLKTTVMAIQRCEGPNGGGCYAELLGMQAQRFDQLAPGIVGAALSRQFAALATRRSSS
jgi:hypothetical protein